MINDDWPPAVAFCTVFEIFLKVIFASLSFSRSVSAFSWGSPATLLWVSWSLLRALSVTSAACLGKGFRIACDKRSGGKRTVPSGKKHNPFWQHITFLWANDSDLLRAKDSELLREKISELLRAKDSELLQAKDSELLRAKDSELLQAKDT